MVDVLERPPVQQSSTLKTALRSFFNQTCEEVISEIVEQCAQVAERHGDLLIAEEIRDLAH